MSHQVVSKDSINILDKIERSLEDLFPEDLPQDSDDTEIPPKIFYITSALAKVSGFRFVTGTYGGYKKHCWLVQGFYIIDIYPIFQLDKKPTIFDGSNTHIANLYKEEPFECPCADCAETVNLIALAIRHNFKIDYSHQ